MAKIEFKSVGDKSSSEKFVRPANVKPIGIKTPLRPGSSNDGVFAMHFSLSEQIHDNLRNLILTNHGERVGNYFFGANLKELTMEFGRREFDEESIRRIRDAINTYMPFVVPESFESTTIQRNESSAVELVKIEISYSIPDLNVSSKVLEIFMNIGG